MSHATEQIPLPDPSVPLPWLIEPWSAVDPVQESSTSAAASAASFDPQVNVCQKSRTATTDQRPMAPEAAQMQPQGSPASQRTAGGITTAPVLLLAGLGLLVLVAILIMLVGAGHGTAFSGAHGLHHVSGIMR